VVLWNLKLKIAYVLNALFRTARPLARLALMIIMILMSIWATILKKKRRLKNTKGLITSHAKKK